MGRESINIMNMNRTNNNTLLNLLVMMVGLMVGVNAAPGPGGHFAYGSQVEHCHTLYETRLEEECHTVNSQECHEEYDTIVDTDYVQDCRDIVRHYCEQVSTKVSKTSSIVGQESYLASTGPVKREADAIPGPGYEINGKPKCQAKTTTQCTERPVQKSRQVPRQVCLPVARQVCAPREVKIPYNTCGDSHVFYEQFSKDVTYEY